MKKVLISLILICLFLTGCFNKKDDSLNKILKKYSNLNSYILTGDLEIINNEDRYNYDVKVIYQKKDKFYVSLKNRGNNHEQIILKNEDGVYVVTPSLNKSFKFQSDWPYNNSQIYLLQPIITDLYNDTSRTIEKNNDGYILTSKVNYSSEKEFAKQRIYVDKDKNITKVEVLDSADNVKMILTVIEIDYKAKFDTDYFSANKYQISEESKENKTTQNNTNNITNESQSNKESTTSKLEDIVYPMYIPVDTQLSGQDIVQTTNGERAILTFTGESAFTVVQETLNDAKSTNYVYGDPYLILDTVGSITDYSVSWISNGVEYSVMSDTMNIDELLTVAQSISVRTVGK